MTFEEEYKEILKVHKRNEFTKRYVKDFSKRWEKCRKNLQGNGVDLGEIFLVGKQGDKRRAAAVVATALLMHF